MQPVLISARLAALVGLLLAAEARFAVAAPIALGGWSTDDIVGATEGSPYSGAGVNGFSFYQQGLAGESQGFPANASGVLSPAPTTGTVFQFAPYAGNNTDIVTNGAPQTLSLVAAHQYQSLQFLNAAADATVSWNVTLNFSDGSHTTTGTFSDADWVNGPPGNTNGTQVFTNYGLVNAGTNGGGYNGFLFSAEHDYTLSLTDQAKILTSLTLTNTSGGFLMFLAASGVKAAPEPSSLILCGLGALGLLIAARRRRSAGPLVALAVAMALCSTTAQAAPIQAITSAENSNNGNVATYSVGWDFSISQPIYVTSLGKFDIGPADDATVGLYAHGGALLASTTVLTTDPTQSAGSLTASYHAITPILLPAGDYVIYGQTRSSGFAEWSSATTFAPGITWNTGVASAGSSDPLPLTAPGTWPIENSFPSRYFGPTFQFIPTPEPASCVLFALGALGLVVVARRRRG